MPKLSSAVVSIRLPAHSNKRLRLLASRRQRTVSDVGARLLEEGMRRDEFPHIDFRDTPSGRDAYIQGTRLSVWHVIRLAREYKNSSKKVAKHLNWPEWKVQAAFNYAAKYPQEIRAALDQQDAMTFEKLQQILPNIEKFVA